MASPNSEVRDSGLPLTPRVPALAGVLANQVVVELYRFPGPTTTELKLHVAARVANRGGWKGYRGGRQRLAGWVGVYTEWLAPSSDWHFEALVALDQTWASWSNGETRFADVVAPGGAGDLDLPNLAAIASGLLDTGEVDAGRAELVVGGTAQRGGVGDPRSVGRHAVAFVDGVVVGSSRRNPCYRCRGGGRHRCWREPGGRQPTC